MRVLVADDDDGARLVARAMIESLGHACLEAVDGDDAWRLLQAEVPDVLMTDWIMPGLDGSDICRAVRERAGSGNPQYTYIIMVTSLAHRDDVRAGMSAGADDYLTKPLDLFDLETRLMVASRVTALHQQLAHTHEALRREARTDSLTGLGNRAQMASDLTRIRGHAHRYDREYSIAIFDVDFFKAFNDTYGHQAGDIALCAVADALLGQCRGGDGAYRFGGEEFVVILAEQGPAGAMAAADRMRAAIEARQIPHVHGAGCRVLTVSAGTASAATRDGLSPEELLRLADGALYDAKASGRNRVVAAAEV